MQPFEYDRQYLSAHQLYMYNEFMANYYERQQREQFEQVRQDVRSLELERKDKNLTRMDSLNLSNSFEVSRLDMVDIAVRLRNKKRSDRLKRFRLSAVEYRNM